MVVLCKSSAGLRFYLFIQLFIFIYLLFTIFKIERWQKQYMSNLKTIMYWVNWWLFYTDRHKACQRRDSAWAGHLKPRKVKKCWRQPSATAPDSPCRPGDAAPCAPFPWASCMLEGSEGYWLYSNRSVHLMTQRALPSPATGFWWRWLPLGTPTQGKHPNVHGTSSSTHNLFCFSSGILESRCSAGIERDFLCHWVHSDWANARRNRFHTTGAREN